MTSPEMRDNMRGDETMSTIPIRPETEPEIDEETRAILDERLRTIDQDALESVDCKEALAEIRRSLKSPVPR
jgi:hypothetical protein